MSTAPVNHDRHAANGLGVDAFTRGDLGYIWNPFLIQIPEAPQKFRVLPSTQPNRGYEPRETPSLPPERKTNADASLPVVQLSYADAAQPAVRIVRLASYNLATTGP